MTLRLKMPEIWVALVAAGLQPRGKGSSQPNNGHGEIRHPARMKEPVVQGVFVGAPQGAMRWWPQRHGTAGHPFRGFRRSHRRSFELSQIQQDTDGSFIF